MVAIENDGSWRPAIKLSESPAKSQNPGDKDLVRVYDERGRATADLLSIAGQTLPEDVLTLQHPIEHGVRRELTGDRISATEALLTTVFADGQRAGDEASLAEIRERRDRDIEKLDPGVRRLVNPHTYHVSLTPELWDLKQRLIDEARHQS